ncbi:hypothetical protein IAT38_000735 [Cryptococcus sp. DSM 104549]
MPAVSSTPYSGIINFTQRDDPHAEDYMVFRAGILPPSEDIKVPLYDMRKAVEAGDGEWVAASEQIDLRGFACSQTPSKYSEADVSTPEGIAGYLEETVELTKKLFGATDVIAWNSRIRRNDPTPPPVTAEILQHKVEKGFVPKEMPRPIAKNAHCDQTYEYSEVLLKRAKGDDVFQKYRRGQIINLWRPLVRVTNAPLAVMDHRTMAPTDVGVHASAFGPLYHFFHNEEQKWYYIPNMEPKDALWIKCFDSDKSVAAYAPHVAVQQTWGDEVPEEEREVRVSLEVRLFLFYE